MPRRSLLLLLFLALVAAAILLGKQYAAPLGAAASAWARSPWCDLHQLMSTRSLLSLPSSSATAAATAAVGSLRQDGRVEEIRQTAVVVLPFSTEEDAREFMLSGASPRWWKEVASFARVFVVVLNRMNLTDSMGEDAAFASSFVIPNLELRIRTKITVVVSSMGRMLGPDEFPLIPFARSNSFQILSALTWVHRSFPGFQVAAVITKSVYVDPKDLGSIMSAIPSLEKDVMVAFENASVIASKGAISQLSDVVTRKATSISCQSSCRLGDDVNTCLSTLGLNFVTLNDFVKSGVAGVDPNMRSCSVPKGKPFGFHEFKINSFKTCSFVGGLTQIYEAHAVRLLQRLSRGLPLEVDWSEDQNAIKDKYCDIAIGITTVPDKIGERALVRETWGKIARSLGTIRLFFVYGTPENKPSNEVLALMVEERKKFNDIVILPIMEGYFRMFTKVATWLGWAEANTNCATVMKVDPDTYLRLFPLLKFMFRRNILPLSASLNGAKDPLSGVYFGLHTFVRTSREEGHKWYFFDMWPHEFLPPFITGAALGMSRPFAKYVYERREPDWRLDDPGIGIILHGLSIGTDRRRIESGDEWAFGTHYKEKCINDKVYDNPFFAESFDMTAIFENDIMLGLFCKHIRNITTEPQVFLGSRDDQLQRNRAPSSLVFLFLILVFILGVAFFKRNLVLRLQSWFSRNPKVPDHTL